MSVSINGTTGLSLGAGSITFADSTTQSTAASGFGFKNRIINGAMMIDQRNAGASVTANNDVFPVDRFSFGMTQSSKGTGQQSTTAPAGFTNSVLFTSSSAYSVLSSDSFIFRQLIEGFNTADLGWGAAGAQSVTLSFWVRSSLTGSFGVVLANSAQNRCYPILYTISAANTWEQKTITIPGDTTGTWVTNNGIGLRVSFGLGVGSTYSGASGSWSASTLTGVTGATSVVGTNGATFYITGVQLEKGSTATSFDYRPYGTELALCQRYYAKMLATGGAYTAFGCGMWLASNAVNGFLKYPTTMRTAPTISYGGTPAVTYGVGLIANISSVGTVYAGTDSVLWQPGLPAVGTAGQAGTFISNNDTTTYVAFASEL